MLFCFVGSPFRVHVCVCVRVCVCACARVCARPSGEDDLRGLPTTYLSAPLPPRESKSKAGELASSQPVSQLPALIAFDVKIVGVNLQAYEKEGPTLVPLAAGDFLELDAAGVPMSSPLPLSGGSKGPRASFAHVGVGAKAAAADAALFHISVDELTARLKQELARTSLPTRGVPSAASTSDALLSPRGSTQAPASAAPSPAPSPSLRATMAPGRATPRTSQPPSPHLFGLPEHRLSTPHQLPESNKR